MRPSGELMYEFLAADGIVEIAKEYHVVFTISSHILEIQD